MIVAWLSAEWRNRAWHRARQRRYYRKQRKYNASSIGELIIKYTVLAVPTKLPYSGRNGSRAIRCPSHRNQERLSSNAGKRSGGLREG